MKNGAMDRWLPPPRTWASCASAQVSDSEAMAASRFQEGGAGRGPQGLACGWPATGARLSGALGATDTPSCASSRCAARSTPTDGGSSVVAAYENAGDQS